MKNILIIVPSLGGGGAEKVLITLLNNIDATLYNVELLIIFNSGIYFSELPPHVKLSIVYPQNNSLCQKLDFSFYYKFNCVLFEKLSVVRALKRHRYDTIISFLEGRAVKAHSYIAARAKRNISWIHTDMVNNHYTNDISMKQDLERYAYSLMDEVVFVSKESEQQFQKLGYSIKKSCVINNPIDSTKIKLYMNNSSNNRRFTIVLCGRLTSVKGYDRMIRVAKRLKDDGFSFQVNFIGEGEERGNLQQLINSLELDDCVSLLGFKKPPYSIMAKADLFVSTSFTEGYPVNICEALCLGLPVVATRCTGTTEILGENGEYGLVAEQNEDSIFECIKSMIIDGNLLESYKQKAMTASQKFSIEKTMGEIYEVL